MSASSITCARARSVPGSMRICATESGSCSSATSSAAPAAARCWPCCRGCANAQRLDFVVVNGENAAGGHGITSKIAREMFAAGVDVITLGNHTYRQNEVYRYLDEEERILRPANFLRGQPGHGTCVVTERDGRPPRRRVALRQPVHERRRCRPSPRPTRRSTRCATRPTTSSSTCTPRRPARRSGSAGTSTAA